MAALKCDIFQVDQSILLVYASLSQSCDESVRMISSSFYESKLNFDNAVKCLKGGADAISLLYHEEVISYMPLVAACGRLHLGRS